LRTPHEWIEFCCGENEHTGQFMPKLLT
jgi:hypothetical protein